MFILVNMLHILFAWTHSSNYMYNEANKYLIFTLDEWTDKHH